MKVTIGWGRTSITYRGRSGRENSHGQIEFIECGGYDASPTGVSYVWTFDPNSVDTLIADLLRVKDDHEAWVKAFLEDAARLES